MLSFVNCEFVLPVDSRRDTLYFTANDINDKLYSLREGLLWLPTDSTIAASFIRIL